MEEMRKVLKCVIGNKQGQNHLKLISEAMTQKGSLFVERNHF